MTQMMGIYMPLLLGYFAYSFAAGLALYFVVSNTLAIGQALIMKRYRKEPEPQGKKSTGKKAVQTSKSDRAKGKKLAKPKEAEAGPKETGALSFLANIQASLMKLLGAPPESTAQGSNPSESSKE
jgi:hypothetical protein